MEEQYISFEIAKILKARKIEIGEMGIGYNSDGKLSRFRGWAPYPAVTQSLLQKWLRDVHNIDVYPTCDWTDQGRVYISGISYINNSHEVDIWISQDKQDKFFTSTIKYKTFEEALEVALLKALDLIK